MRILFENKLGEVEASLTRAQEELRYFWCSNLASNPTSPHVATDSRWNARQTEADVECDRIVQTHLSSLPFPVNIYSEEQEPSINEFSDVSFLIDPLDGTHNASAGYPMYSCSVAMYEENSYVFGWIYDLSRDIALVAAKGCGAYRKTPLVCRRLQTTSDHTSIEQLSVALLRGRDGHHRSAIERIFWNAGKIRISSCSSLDMCFVAAGTLDVFLDPSSIGHERSSDIAASSLILEEAGGVVLKLNGSVRTRLPPSIGATKDNGPLLACSSGQTAELVLDSLEQND